MITPGRHRPLAQDAWNESAVRVAIEEIAADAIAHSIRTPSGRLTRVTTRSEMATPASTRARQVSFGH